MTNPEQPEGWCVEELTEDDLASLAACQDGDEAGFGDEGTPE